ncbi:MAG: hypothetical protein ACI8RD_005261, partial [Bacillariaceae sp.]
YPISAKLLVGYVDKISRVRSYSTLKVQDLQRGSRRKIEELDELSSLFLLESYPKQRNLSASLIGSYHGISLFFLKAAVRSNRAPCNDRISGSPKPEYRYAILPVITHSLSLAA